LNNNKTIKDWESMMKLNAKSLAVTMMVMMNLMSVSAKASMAEMVESQAMSAIDSSEALKTNLQLMGYRTTSEAAKAFAEVTKKLKSKDLT